MGGNAFTTALPGASFPRMLPAVYQSLKTRLTMRLKDIYGEVAVPHEAPEKVDYGDLDFVVYNPLRKPTHDEIRETLGAQEAVIVEGNPMSHFAVPAEISATDATNVYHQVDVRVCSDLEEFERVTFFNSYGDLGMIIGLLARASQLSVGSSGLRLAKPVPTSPPCILYLSTSFPDILAFLSLSLARWKEGFSTRREIFDWIASSPFFTIWRQMHNYQSQISGKMAPRPMYRAFLEYARTHHSNNEASSASVDINSILQYFGKHDIYSALLHVSRAKQHVKSIFTGKLVEAWTKMTGPPIKVIMEEVRRRLGGNDVLATVCGVSRAAARDNDIDPIHLTLTVWEDNMSRMTEDGIRNEVIETTQVLKEGDALDASWAELNKRKAARKAASRASGVSS